MRTAPSPLKSFRVAARVAAAGACCSIASAAPVTFDWNAPAGGQWAIAANWNPVAIPALDIDTAIIGGALPVTVDVIGVNASIGFFRLNNPAAEIRVRSGRTFSIGQDATLNGTMTIGEEHPTDLSIARFGTLFNSNVTGIGQVVLRGSPADVTRTYVQSPGGRMTTWGSNIEIRGTGSLLGAHRILGTVLADNPGGAIECRGGSVDGFGSGTFIADGGILRLFQSPATDATLEARNNGRIELSAPSSIGSATIELLKRCTVRGPVRSILNHHQILDTDFDGSLEVMPGTGVSFGNYTKTTRLSATVQPAVGNARTTLAFATGTPPGGGEIVLNAQSLPSQSVLQVDQMQFGSAWNVRGQGLISGSITLVGTILADRPTGSSLGFELGTVSGGVIEARGGTVEFLEHSHLQNVNLLASQGGQFKVSRSAYNYPAKWTNVVTDSPVAVITGSELALDGSTINGKLTCDFGEIQLVGTASTVNGDVELLTSPPSRSGRLEIAAGTSLLGSGDIVMRAFAIDNGSSLVPSGTTLPASRTVRGAGMLFGGMTFLGKMIAEGPDAVPIHMRAGVFDGAGQGTIEITSAGGLALSAPFENVTLKNTRVTALDGAPAVRIGLNDQASNGSVRITLSSVDMDAEAIVSQRATELNNSVFRRRCEFPGPSEAFITGTCHFDGGIVIRKPATGDQAVVIVWEPATSFSEIVFANRVTGQSAGTLSIEHDDAIASIIRGTGTIYSPHAIGGTLAPSDESTGSPVGVLTLFTGAPSFRADTIYEVDILSTQSYDRIECSSAVCNGTLRISASPDFYPPPSFNFHIIRGASTGAFASVFGPPGFITTMTYNKAGALARFEKLCGSDLNADGLVDDADFTIFCAGYDTMLCSDPSMPDNCPADLDRDRVVDDRDFRAFVLAYAQMVCPTE